MQRRFAVSLAVSPRGKPSEVDPFDRRSPQNYSIKSKAVLQVSSKNDGLTISQARNELRKHLFFHKEYDPKKDEECQKIVNSKVYRLNTEEPDFTWQPDKEPSLNHYLLSQKDYKRGKRELQPTFPKRTGLAAQRNTLPDIASPRGIQSGSIEIAPRRASQSKVYRHLDIVERMKESEELKSKECKPLPI